jgi:hypothetical protein
MHGAIVGGKKSNSLLNLFHTTSDVMPHNFKHKYSNVKKVKQFYYRPGQSLTVLGS